MRFRSKTVFNFCTGGDEDRNRLTADVCQIRLFICIRDSLHDESITSIKRRMSYQHTPNLFEQQMSVEQVLDGLYIRIIQMIIIGLGANSCVSWV